MKDIDPRFDARFDTIVYPAARKARPFWVLVLLVAVACFLVTLFWPQSETPQPETPVSVAASTVEVEAITPKRDVVSIADADLAERRAERDRNLVMQWSASGH